MLLSLLAIVASAETIEMSAYDDPCDVAREISRLTSWVVHCEQSTRNVAGGEAFSFEQTEGLDAVMRVFAARQTGYGWVPHNDATGVLVQTEERGRPYRSPLEGSAIPPTTKKARYTCHEQPTWMVGALDADPDIVRYHRPVHFPSAPECELPSTEVTGREWLLAISDGVNASALPNYVYHLSKWTPDKYVLSFEDARKPSPGPEPIRKKPERPPLPPAGTRATIRFSSNLCWTAAALSAHTPWTVHCDERIRWFTEMFGDRKWRNYHSATFEFDPSDDMETVISELLALQRALGGAEFAFVPSSDAVGVLIQVEDAFGRPIPTPLGSIVDLGPSDLELTSCQGQLTGILNALSEPKHGFRFQEPGKSYMGYSAPPFFGVMCAHPDPAPAREILSSIADHMEAISGRSWTWHGHAAERGYRIYVHDTRVSEPLQTAATPNRKNATVIEQASLMHIAGILRQARDWSIHIERISQIGFLPAEDSRVLLQDRTVGRRDKLAAVMSAAVRAANGDLPFDNYRYASISATSGVLIQGTDKNGDALVSPLETHIRLRRTASVLDTLEAALELDVEVPEGTDLDGRCASVPTAGTAREILLAVIDTLNDDDLSHWTYHLRWQGESVFFTGETGYRIRLVNRRTIPDKLTPVNLERIRAPSGLDCEAFRCGRGRVNVCHGETDGTFATQCVDLGDARAHAYHADSCGTCE